MKTNEMAVNIFYCTKKKKNYQCGSSIKEYRSSLWTDTENLIIATKIWEQVPLVI